MRLDAIEDITVRPMQQFFSQMPMLRTEIKRWQKQDTTVIIMVQEKKRLQKVAQTLSDFEISATETDQNNLLAHQVQLISGNLDNGFELPIANLVVITEKKCLARWLRNDRDRRRSIMRSELKAILT